MNNQNCETGKNASEYESAIRQDFFRLYRECPIPDGELLNNLALYIKRQDIKRILFLNELYRKIIGITGVIMEFGVRWGQNMALLESFRGIYEPHNYNRKIIGFDTFDGFPAPDEKDGNAGIVSKGSLSVTENYMQYLEKILDYHEKESPIQHIKKFQLVRGDAGCEITRYLEENPETIIALAYFDMDLYEPTLKCLEKIKDHVIKGTVIAFDELNTHIFPGETLALKEVFGLGRYRLNRNLYCALQSYIVVD